MKRAFLDHALRFHPDRQRDQSADARERAEFRMREINAAWAVLRNPAARATYDDELRVADASRAAAPTHTVVHLGHEDSTARRGYGSSAAARAAAFGNEPAEVADLAPASMAEPVRVPRLFTLAPVLLGGTVLVLILVSVAFGAHRPVGGVRVQTVEAFGVGTCVTVVSGEDQGTTAPGEQARQIAVSVPCSAPNTGRVMGRENFPKPCPSGSRALLLVELRQSLCLVEI